jgi:hypothetical protein
LKVESEKITLNLLCLPDKRRGCRFPITSGFRRRRQWHLPVRPPESIAGFRVRKGADFRSQLNSYLYAVI